VRRLERWTAPRPLRVAEEPGFAGPRDS